MKSPRFLAVLGTVMLLGSGTMHAQDTRFNAPKPAPAALPESVPAKGGCELHVWPGSDLRSTYSGWFHGGIVDGAVRGRDGYRKLPANPLDSAAQLTALKRQDMPALLGLSGYRAVWHETPLDSRTLRTSLTRLQPGTPACYAELAVDDVFFQEDVFSGKFLKIIVRYRRFADEGTARQTFGAMLAEKLTLFPPLKPEDDPAAALAELSERYAAVIVRFGKDLQTPRKPKGKR